MCCIVCHCMVFLCVIMGKLRNILLAYLHMMLPKSKIGAHIAEAAGGLTYSMEESWKTVVYVSIASATVSPTAVM